MRKLLYIAVGCFLGLLLLCCGGVLLVPTRNLTPQEQAERDRGQQEFEAKRAREKQRERQRLADQKERDARRAADEEKAAAELAAESFVKRKLTHPSTAKFGWSTNATQKADGSWMVTGTVKAKNALNLELEYAYGCELRLDGDTWNLLDCELLESE